MPPEKNGLIVEKKKKVHTQKGKKEGPVNDFETRRKKRDSTHQGEEKKRKENKRIIRLQKKPACGREREKTSIHFHFGGGEEIAGSELWKEKTFSDMKKKERKNCFLRVPEGKKKGEGTYRRCSLSRKNHITVLFEKKKMGEKKSEGAAHRSYPWKEGI